MRKKTKFRALAIVAVGMAVIMACQLTVSGGTSGYLEDIMKGLSTFVYKVYEWPDKLSVDSDTFSVAESLYTIRDSDTQRPVLWDDDTLEDAMKDFYSTTDWKQFEGMYESVELSNTCEAELTSEVQEYEDLMDAAASEYGFTVYKELFKAIAQARFNEHKVEFGTAQSLGKIHGNGNDQFDLFHINGSWIDGGATPLGNDQAPVSTPAPIPPSTAVSPGAPTPTPTPWPTAGVPLYEQKAESIYTVQQSIDLAAAAFRKILDEAVYPSPYNSDGLICVVEGFEFGGDSSAIRSQFESSVIGLPGVSGFITFTEHCQTQASIAGDDVDYDEIIENYARVIAHNATRSASDYDTYGKYKYSDQKFYQKVFEVYKCTGGGSIDLGNLPEEYKAILQQCMRTWGSEVTSERRAIIQNAVLLYGVTYSMKVRNSPSVDNPRYLDCSSFVGQAYWRSGLYDKDTASWVTGDFSSNFIEIDASQLIPGDIAQKVWNPGGSGASEHIGIYVGTVGGTKYFIHCTRGGGLDGVVVNNYSGFVHFGRSPKL